MDSYKIVGDALGLSVRRAWSLALSVLTSYAVARFLGPKGLGLLSVFTLIPSLTIFGSIGWDQAAMRELPHLIGLGDLRAVSNIRNTAYVAELLLSGCWTAIAVVVAWALPDWPNRVGVLIGAASLLIGKVTRLFVIDTFVEKEFSLQVKVGVAVAAVAAILKVAAAWWFGAVATFAALLLADLCGLWLYWKARSLNLRWRIDQVELWRLTKIGFPMAIASLLSSPHGLMAYLSRAILGSQAGLEVLGLYVFATSVTAYLVAFVGDCVVAYQPHLLEALATASGRDAILKWMVQPSLAIAYVSAIIGSCMLALLPLLITVALPKYVSVIPLLPVFFASALIGCFYYLPATFLASAYANQQAYYTGIWAIAVTLFGGILWCSTRLAWGLAGAAWATVVATCCVGVLTTQQAYRAYIADRRFGVSLALKQLVPLMYVILVHASTSHFTRNLVGTITGHMVLDRLMLAGTTLVLSCVPVLFMANRTFELRKVFPLREATS